jgi:hypothetical protein
VTVVSGRQDPDLARVLFELPGAWRRDQNTVLDQPGIEVKPGERLVPEVDRFTRRRQPDVVGRCHDHDVAISCAGLRRCGRRQRKRQQRDRQQRCRGRSHRSA